MFDIFVYLFENYIHRDACPAPEQLARRLTDAGFEEEEISEALDWLSGLNQAASAQTPVKAAAADSIRVYVDQELAVLGRKGHSFLVFLESAGVLDSRARELIVDRLTASSDHPMPLSRLKVIVLMVLWSEAQPMDTLVLDELLNEDFDDETPVLQ